MVCGGWELPEIYLHEKLRKLVHLLHTVFQEEVKLHSFGWRQWVEQETDAGGNSEDSVVCHLVCPPGLFIGGLRQEN